MTIWKLSRDSLGRHFSEGARLAWIEVQRRRWSQRQLGLALGIVERDASSQANRYLYGERRPGFDMRAAFERVLGISGEAWSQPPTVKFDVPSEIEIGGDTTEAA